MLLWWLLGYPQRGAPPAFPPRWCHVRRLLFFLVGRQCPSHIFSIWVRLRIILHIRRCRSRVRRFALLLLWCRPKLTGANFPCFVTCRCCLAGWSLIMAMGMSARSHKHCGPCSHPSRLAPVLNFWQFLLHDVLAGLSARRPPHSAHIPSVK